MTTSNDVVQHERAPHDGVFFIMRGAERVGELTYRMLGETAIVDHTWVSPALRGAKLAPILVEAVVQWARRENRKISPACSYVRSVMDRTPGYADVLKD
jgi:predicted GNAT family acetyltransferase